MEDTAEVVDRREGPYGEVVLRRRGGTYEIIENGCFLMDTSDGRSERLLVRAALEALQDSRGEPAPGGWSVLIGGLGVGFSLAEAAAEPRWGRITVLERETSVVEWHREGRLAPFSAHALDDPRVTVVEADLISHLRETGPAGPARPAETHDALCLDIDNGPGWTVTESNGELYAPAGLAACRARLTPGGVLAVWSAQPSPGFDAALADAGFGMIRTIEVPVPHGVPDVVHLAVGPA